MRMTTRRRSTTAVAILLIAITICLNSDPVAAADQTPAGSSPAEASGTSIAEKIACVYLLVGGSIMLYYGPRERENGQLTMDGKSEAVGGAAAIGISVALLRDIVKKHRRQHHS